MNAIARILRPDPWTERAACKGKPIAWFYAIQVGSGVPAGLKKGLSTCMRCPVRRECLISALQNREEGTWGGTLPQWRRNASERDTERLLAYSRAWAAERGLCSKEEP